MIKKEDLKIGLVTTDNREVIDIRCGTIIYKMKEFIYHESSNIFCKEFSKKEKKIECMLSNQDLQTENNYKK